MKKSTWRKIEEGLYVTGASLGFMGVLGFLLVRSEEKKYATLAERAAALAAGGALGGGGGGAAPETGPGPGPGPGPKPETNFPQRITGSSIVLEPGGKYVAAVNVSFPLSLAASASKVRAQAASMGFRDIAVSTDHPPPGAPPVTPGADYYVVGTYARDRAAVGRSHAGGQVTIVDAWRMG